jgi:hypothetical protein
MMRFPGLTFGGMTMGKGIRQLEGLDFSRFGKLSLSELGIRG